MIFSVMLPNGEAQVGAGHKYSQSVYLVRGTTQSLDGTYTVTVNTTKCGSNADFVLVATQYNMGLVPGSQGTLTGLPAPSGL